MVIVGFTGNFIPDFIEALNPARLGVTIVAGLVFGSFVLGTVATNPAIAAALGNVKYSKQIAKAAFIVLLMFLIPQLILSFLGLDGPTGRATAALILSALFCGTLDVGIRLRFRWAVWRGHRRERRSAADHRC